MAIHPNPSIPAKLKKIMMPMVKKVVPGTVMQDIASVQPMSAPSGLIFSMRATYSGPPDIVPFTGLVLLKVNEDAETSALKNALAIQQNLLSDFDGVDGARLLTNRAKDVFVELTLVNAAISHKIQDMIHYGPHMMIYALSHEPRDDGSWYMMKAYCSAEKRTVIQTAFGSPNRGKPQSLYQVNVFKGSAATADTVGARVYETYEDVLTKFQLAAGF